MNDARNTTLSPVTTLVIRGGQIPRDGSRYEIVCDEICGRMRAEVILLDRPHTCTETCAGCGAKLG